MLGPGVEVTLLGSRPKHTFSSVAGGYGEVQDAYVGEPLLNVSERRGT